MLADSVYLNPSRRNGARIFPVVRAVAAVILGCVAPVLLASDYEEYFDIRGDALIRRTDWGGNGPVDKNAHHLPDLVQITIGNWVPNNPFSDLYTGRWDEQATRMFLRVDLVFEGLFNPPGLVEIGGSGFDPYRFGPHPLFGFVEMDADEYVDTGGEISFPDIRYLGMGARFGGIPGDRSDLRDRFARSFDDFDGDCDTPPFVDWSGEEFHIAIQGEEYRSHIVKQGDGDAIFEAGETWILKGVWLHRAHGFEPFSFACGSNQGVYDPPSEIRWSHKTGQDETTVTLVFPITQEASQAWRGDGQVQGWDCSPFNQASIQEALVDLVLSGQFWQSRTAECKQLIVDWGDWEAEDYLRARKWVVNAAFATSYTQAGEAPFVWTDLFPDANVGDVNGDGTVNSNDTAAILDYISKKDGKKEDADGVVNGEVGIKNFAVNFSVYDVNYDGKVSQADTLSGVKLGDMDDNGVVNLDDWVLYSACLRGPGSIASTFCRTGDFDFDGDVDLEDAAQFMLVFEGGG